MERGRGEGGQMIAHMKCALLCTNHARIVWDVARRGGSRSAPDALRDSLCKHGAGAAHACLPLGGGTNTCTSSLPGRSNAGSRADGADAAAKSIKGGPSARATPSSSTSSRESRRSSVFSVEESWPKTLTGGDRILSCEHHKEAAQRVCCSQQSEAALEERLTRALGSRLGYKARL
eukprot:scaffold136001_cov31-Tisochrysis_lutea.AAC.4